MTAGLTARLEAAPDHGKDVVFLDGADPEVVSWARLHEDACRAAAVLQRSGAGPGDRVALFGETSRALLTVLRACWLGGSSVIVPPLRTRTESEAEFRAKTSERLSRGDVALTVCDPELTPMAGHGPTLAFPDVMSRAAQAPSSDFERAQDDPELTAILQFTSGSTADPKGVVIPQRCLLDNLDAVADRAPLDVSDDVMVSWLPLYHDMGLVYAAATAMTTGVQLVLAPPSRFISSPGSWMRWMQDYGGTWTIGPNFSLAMAARLLARRPEQLDLRRCWRLGSGSEPVDPSTMDAFAAQAARHGLDPGALYAGYGMAEATVAVSFVGPGEGLTTDVVDGNVLEYEGRAEPSAPGDPGSRRLARCGPPLRGMQVRIADPATGAELDSRTVGEIELRGPSVVPGYFRRPDATASAFRRGGWLRSGDLGYMVDGELVVCGRVKDIIIVGGRNIFPEDVERSAHQVDGVRTGNVIAFAVEGGRRGDSLVVVAEMKQGDAAKLRDGVARAVRESVGVRPDEVVLLPPGALPKTSSGKLKRSLCRARYEAGELEAL